MVQKYEFLDDNVREVNNPDMHYTYIYAPNATSIRAGSAKTIFCGPNTKINMHCNDIRRGNWYLESGYIRNKDNKNFKYELTFQKQDMLESLDFLDLQRHR